MARETLALARVAWRLANPTPLPPPGTPRWQRVAAASTHGILYLLILAQPLVGWAMSSAGGHPVALFDWFVLQRQQERDESNYVDQIWQYHIPLDVAISRLSTRRTRTVELARKSSPKSPSTCTRSERKAIRYTRPSARTKTAVVTAWEGFATGGAMSVFLASWLGIPVSTTHVITGAIVGVGSAQRASSVRWGLAGKIVWAWILTIPASAGIAGIVYLTLHVVIR